MKTTRTPAVWVFGTMLAVAVLCGIASQPALRPTAPLLLQAAVAGPFDSDSGAGADDPFGDAPAEDGLFDDEAAGSEDLLDVGEAAANGPPEPGPFVDPFVDDAPPAEEGGLFGELEDMPAETPRPALDDISVSHSNQRHNGVVDLSGMSASERKIKAALHAQLTDPLEFYEIPLAEAVMYIQDYYEIPVMLDVAALESVAISPDEPLTINIQDVSLAAGLKHLLRPLGEVAYIIQDEVLLITTREVAESTLSTRVYDVSRIGIHAHEIVDVIPSVVCYDSWLDAGAGEGEVKPIGDSLIAVMQSQRVHEEVMDFLKQLGRANSVQASEDPFGSSTVRDIDTTNDDGFF